MKHLSWFHHYALQFTSQKKRPDEIGALQGKYDRHESKKARKMSTIETQLSKQDSRNPNLPVLSG